MEVLGILCYILICQQLVWKWLLGMASTLGVSVVEGSTEPGVFVVFLYSQSFGTRLKTTARGWVTSPSSGDRSKRSLLCSAILKSIVSCLIFTWFSLFLFQFVLTSSFPTFQVRTDLWAVKPIFFPTFPFFFLSLFLWLSSYLLCRAKPLWSV